MSKPQSYEIWGFQINQVLIGWSKYKKKKKVRVNISKSIFDVWDIGKLNRRSDGENPIGAVMKGSDPIKGSSFI